MAKKRTSRKTPTRAPGEQDFIDAAAIEPAASEGDTAWGVLTNSGNLRDILARGCIVPAEARKKHYNDLSDDVPGHVVLLRSPIPESLVKDVCKDAAHLFPVFLVMEEGLAATAQHEGALAFPSPVPLSLVRKVLFPSKADLAHFTSNPRRGQDSEDVPFEAALFTSEEARQFSPPSIPRELDTRGGGTEIYRRIDSWAAVWAFAMSGFGAGNRHVALTSAQRLLGGDHSRLLLFPLGSRGLLQWLLSGNDTSDFTIEDHVTFFFLGELTHQGGPGKPGMDALLENLLTRCTGARLGSENAAERLRKRLEQMLDALRLPGPGAGSLIQEIRGAARSFAMFVLRQEEIEGSLEKPGQYINRSPEERLAALFHGAWHGWTHIDKDGLPLHTRRLATHLASMQPPNANADHVIPSPALVLPPDNAGWLRKTLGEDEAKWKKFAQSAGWDHCWHTTITMPDVEPEITVKNRKRVLSFPGRAKVSASFSMETALQRLTEYDFDTKTLKACERMRKRAASKK